VRGAVVIGIALVIGFLLLQQGVGDEDLLVQSEAASNPSESGTTGGDDGGDTGSETEGADTDDTSVTTDPSNAGSIPVATTLLPARANNEVKVVVANAARVDGAAGRATEELRALGYTTLPASNGEEAADTSSLLYAEGYQAEALVMANEIGLDAANVVPMPDPIPISEPPADANIVLLLGRDLAQPA
jgi:hypothetical protein